MTGVGARVRWWQRLLSLVGVAVLVLVMGIIIALLVLVLFVAADVILEIVVG